MYYGGIRVVYEEPSMFIKISSSSDTPVYLQVEAALRREISNGRWKPGEALPAERQLAKDLKISRITLRKALQGLEAAGFLRKQQGSGNFVPPRVEQNLGFLTGFSQDMRSRGLDSHSRWLKRGVFPASPEEAMAFGIPAHSPVSRLERVRMSGGEPMALELAALPAKYLGNPKAVKESLYSFLGKRNLRPVRAMQRLRAVAAPPGVAELLGIRSGAPVLYIERTSYLPDGSVLEFTRSHYRGDRYDFVAELKGDPNPAS